MPASEAQRAANIQQAKKIIHMPHLVESEGKKE